MSLPPRSFYFIRHGQTDWNLRNLIMGQMDIPLNKYGVQQAQHAAEKLQNITIRAIVTSPLLRAHQTASIIAEKLQLPMIVHADLKEAHFGQQEGRQKNDDFWYDRWKNGECHGGESYETFNTRIVRGMHEILSSHAGPVLIVAHGGLYMTIREMLQAHHDISNCSIVYHEPTTVNDSPIWQTRLI